MFQLQIFGIILFVQDSIFSLPFVSLLFLATRAELLVVKYRHKSRDKESPTKRKKVEHRAFSHSAVVCNQAFNGPPMHHTGIKIWMSDQTSDPYRVVIWYYGSNRQYLANYSEGKFFFKWPKCPKCPKSLFFTKADGRWLSFLICSFFLR